MTTPVPNCPPTPECRIAARISEHGQQSRRARSRDHKAVVANRQRREAWKVRIEIMKDEQYARRAFRKFLRDYFSDQHLWKPVRVRSGQRAPVGSSKKAPFEKRLSGALPRYSFDILDRKGRRGIFLKIGYDGAGGNAFGVLRRRVEYSAKSLDALRIDGAAMLVSNVASDLAEAVVVADEIEAFNRAERANAKVSINLILNFPQGASEREREQILRMFCQRAFGDHHLPYVAFIHLPMHGGKPRNPHAHVTASFRPVVRQGAYRYLIGKELRTDLDGAEGCLEMRRILAEVTTKVMRQAGFEHHYTHLSNASRGLAILPQGSLSKAESEAAKRGEHVPANERNRQLIYDNMARLLDPVRTWPAGQSEAVVAKTSKQNIPAYGTIESGANVIRAPIVQRVRTAILPLVKRPIFPSQWVVVDSSVEIERPFIDVRKPQWRPLIIGSDRPHADRTLPPEEGATSARRRAPVVTRPTVTMCRSVQTRSAIEPRNQRNDQGVQRGISIRAVGRQHAAPDATVRAFRPTFAIVSLLRGINRAATFRNSAPIKVDALRGAELRKLTPERAVHPSPIVVPGVPDRVVIEPNYRQHLLIQLPRKLLTNEAGAVVARRRPNSWLPGVIERVAAFPGVLDRIVNEPAYTKHLLNQLPRKSSANEAPAVVAQRGPNPQLPAMIESISTSPGVPGRGGSGTVYTQNLRFRLRPVSPAREAVAVVVRHRPNSRLVGMIERSPKAIDLLPAGSKKSVTGIVSTTRGAMTNAVSASNRPVHGKAMGADVKITRAIGPKPETMLRHPQYNDVVAAIDRHRALVAKPKQTVRGIMGPIQSSCTTIVGAASASLMPAPYKKSGSVSSTAIWESLRPSSRLTKPVTARDQDDRFAHLTLSRPVFSTLPHINTAPNMLIDRALRNGPQGSTNLPEQTHQGGISAQVRLQALSHQMVRFTEDAGYYIPARCHDADLDAWQAVFADQPTCRAIKQEQDVRIGKAAHYLFVNVTSPDQDVSLPAWVKQILTAWPDEPTFEQHRELIGRDLLAEAKQEAGMALKRANSDRFQTGVAVNQLHVRDIL